jgi:predicted ester cyclase
MNPGDMIKLVEQFIDAYNAFDIDGMIAPLHRDCSFRNISGGQMNASTNGVEDFRKLAEMSKSLFSSRRQTISGFHWDGSTLVVEIDFEGTLQADIPDGPKAGQTLNLHGRSEYRFQNGRIIQLTDIS